MDYFRQSARSIHASQENIVPNRKPLAARLTGLQQRTADFLIRRRRVVLAAVMVFLLAVEAAEHLILMRFGEGWHILFDLLVYLAFLPAGLWLLLNLLEDSARERELAVVDSDLRMAFSQKLGEAASWEELLKRLIEYPHQIAPNALVTLYVFNPVTARMEPEVSCQRDGTITLKPPGSLNPDTLPVGSLPQLLLQNGGDFPFLNARHYPAPAQLPPHRYDLPVTRSDQVIGVFKLEYPLGSSPSQSEIRALKAVAPIMALALEVGLLENLSAEQAAASAAQRQQIAQTLHDTLAQNISYLRLKLDMLTGENAIHEIGVVLQELERMRAAADEAYQQVRSTLNDLIPVQGQDLASLLRLQAEAIAERSGLALEFNQTGTAFPLPAAVRQQVLYILREAFHNIEKHARASRVQLQMDWLEDELMIKLTDNGVGFDVHAVSSDGHFGLWIMQNRAQEIGGVLKIGPAGEQGTEVSLWLARPGRGPSQEG